MPQAANITVKKADGVADVIYTVISPSAGDSAPAIWRNKTVGNAVMHQPELRLSSKEANGGKERRLRATFVYPQVAVNTTTGITSVVDKSMASADWTISKSMSDAAMLEFAHQFANLLYATLTKSCVIDGVSAT